MLKLFKRYAYVGLINTIIHWVVFAIFYTSGLQQSFSNFAGFCVAVTFSFFANARWTFNSEATTIRYMLYVFFMGTMATTVGWYADDLNIRPIITLVLFSGISLICGFAYSNFFIFKNKK